MADCGVFGIPDEEFGESLAAHVQLAPGACIDADDIRAHVAARLAKYKVPKVVVFEAQLPPPRHRKTVQAQAQRAVLAAASRRLITRRINPVYITQALHRNAQQKPDEVATICIESDPYARGDLRPRRTPRRRPARISSNRVTGLPFSH